MSVELVSGIAGVILSLALSYFPVFGKWFNAQDSEVKVAVNGVLLVVAAVGVYSAACAGLGADLNLPIACDRAGLISLLGSLLSALLANQSTYMAFVKPFAKTNPA